ncbi:hypothetical protein [Dactylosporangium sp. CA-092794]|uniref:hypothetical protein n=1 Tax=Dactylosporangium sp. CA-092794 TaxID=3239929 RepID=UPI003D89D4EC
MPAMPDAPGRAALLGWMAVGRADDERYNSWYSYEHVPERLAVPGFVRCCRFRSVGGGPQTIYFTWYEVAGLAVLTSPAYLERLDNPTPLTRATAPCSRLLARGAFEVAGRWGGPGVGGVVRVLPLAVPAAELAAAPVAAALAEAAGGARGYAAGLAGACLLRNDVAVAGARAGTSEGRLTDPAASPGGDVLVLEADSTAQLDHWARLLAGLGLCVASTEWSRWNYRLMFARRPTP